MFDITGHPEPPENEEFVCCYYDDMRKLAVFQTKKGDILMEYSWDFVSSDFIDIKPYLLLS